MEEFGFRVSWARVPCAHAFPQYPFPWRVTDNSGTLLLFVMTFCVLGPTWFLKKNSRCVRDEFPGRCATLTSPFLRRISKEFEMEFHLWQGFFGSFWPFLVSFERGFAQYFGPLPRFDNSWHYNPVSLDLWWKMQETRLLHRGGWKTGHHHCLPSLRPTLTVNGKRKEGDHVTKFVFRSLFVFKS